MRATAAPQERPGTAARQATAAPEGRHRRRRRQPEIAAVDEPGLVVRPGGRRPPRLFRRHRLHDDPVLLGESLRSPGLGNLAADGDLEYGTPAGWYGIFGGGGTLLISDTTAAGYAHAGRYSAQAALRTQLYHGPAYRLPTGLGKYTITGWAFQKDDASIGELPAHHHLRQHDAISPTRGRDADPGRLDPIQRHVRYAHPYPRPPPAIAHPRARPRAESNWRRIVVNQAANGTPVMLPDLFMDDVVVQVSDSHNLVGNSNFEGGFTDGWTAAARS